MCYSTGASCKTIAVFALLGALSGAIATVLLFTLPTDRQIEIGGFLMLSPLSIGAGLVFGFIFGCVLNSRALASARSAVLFTMASTASYFVAVNLALHLVDELNEIWQIGMIAGLAGSACLTASAATLLPVVRQVKPIALMLVAGCLFGVLLEVALAEGEIFWRWLALFAPWQAAYAAAFATALPAAGGGER